MDSIEWTHFVNSFWIFARVYLLCFDIDFRHLTPTHITWPHIFNDFSIWNCSIYYNKGTKTRSV